MFVFSENIIKPSEFLPGKIGHDLVTEQQKQYSITDSMDMNLSKFWEIVERQRSLACRGPWDHKELDVA